MRSRLFRRPRVAITFAFVAVALSALPALAFNDTGHRIVALVAYRQLDRETRESVVEVLKRHDRFEEDFLNKMPDDVKEASQAVQNTWIFLQAATWPDIARGFRGDDKSRFHHPTWHYVNEPLFLSEEDQTAIGQVPVNLDRQWTPGMAADDMNIIQALKKCTADLSDAETSDADKAVALCWLFHCVGDLHQPMHASALFTQQRFPKGDRGGNSIRLVKGKNLHSLWDGLLGGTNRLRTIQNKVATFLQDADLEAAGQLAAESLEFETWLDESRELAEASAYHTIILEAVADAENDTNEDLEKIQLPDEYYADAGDAAKKRVVEAGFRLAAVLKGFEW